MTCSQISTGSSIGIPVVSIAKFAGDGLNKSLIDGSRGMCYSVRPLEIQSTLSFSLE